MTDPAEPTAAQPIRLSAWHFAALLGVMLFAAFPQVMLGQHSFFFRDYGVLGYPFIFHHHEAFWRGELPLWNPLSNCGAPFLAQWGTMTLYPFSVIYLLLPLPGSLGYFCLAHLFLGGLGMYFLAREWTRHDFAAAFAGVAYVFNGVMFSCVVWPNYLVALGWMPWVVMCAQRAWRGDGRQVVIAAILGALQMLAGVPELVVLTWLLIGVLWLTEWLANRREFRMAVRLASVVALIAGLTAAQLLPFFDLLAHSQRTGDVAASKWAMPGWGWANFLVPLFHTYKIPQGPCFQHQQGFMTSYYPGVAVLVLAGWAAWRVRIARVWALGALVLFSWIFALGESGFVFAWVKRAVPLVGFARFPIKFILLGAFVLPLLSAYAIAQLAPAMRRKQLSSIFTVGGAAVVLTGLIILFVRAYPFPLERWPALWHNALVRVTLACVVLGGCGVAVYLQKASLRAMAALVALSALLADTLTHTEKQNPTISTQWFATGLWQERNGASVGRVFISPESERQLLYSTVSNPLHDFIGKRLALWSNLNVVERVPKVNGSSTLRLREQDAFEKALYPSNSLAEPSQPILDFLGVTHVTGGNATQWNKRSSALPLVTAGQRPDFVGKNVAMRSVLAADFEPQRVVYLPEELRGAIRATNATTAVVSNLSFSPKRISFTVSADAAAMVVLAQSFYHSWKAEVDGKKTPVYRANYAFQALEVPKGDHRVVVTYQETRLIIGGWISGISMLGCVLVWLRKSSGLCNCSPIEAKRPSNQDSPDALVGAVYKV
jgi:hypothetical protein